jgi:regulator of nucleoside diphosphate kinase
VKFQVNHLRPPPRLCPERLEIAMFVSDVCHLTTKDYATLEIMQKRSLSGDELMNSILRRKLSRAIVMLGDQIPAAVATLGSQVTFRVNEGPAETRKLASEDFHGLAGLLPVIPISHPRGLAIMGVAEGAGVLLRPDDGPEETLTVLRVIHQPEAARRTVNQRLSDARVHVKTRQLLVRPHRSERVAPVPLS